MTDGSQRPAQTGGMSGKTIGSLQLAVVIGVLVTALALNRILVAAVSDNGPPPTPVQAALVEVIRPEIVTERLVIEETGTVEPRSELALSPEVSGRIVSVKPGLAAGTSFKSGEVLFTINQEDYRLRLRQAEADLRTAKSALSLEEAEAASAIREWELVNPGEPVPTLVAREPQLAQARAAVDVAEAALDDARLDLRRTEFSLPFDGRVLETSVEPGLTVTANQSYGTVYSGEGVEVVVGLSPRDLDALRPAIGRQAVVTGRVGSRGVTAPASVIRVESALDTRSRLISAVLGFEGEAPFLPGTFVSAQIMGPELENVFVLPASAVSIAGNVWLVEEGALTRREAEVLTRTDETVVIAAFDYASGIVTTLPAGAREGLEVRILEEPGAAVETAQAGDPIDG